MTTKLLAPTMNKMTFDDYDKFQRKDFAEQLTKVIKTFYPFYKESFVLSLNATYGSGKTTFLKMWQEELHSEHEVIYINAWETDFDEEPLIPIISALLKHIDKKKGTEKVIETLKKSLQGAMGASAFAVTQISEKLTGFNPDKTLQKGIEEFNYGDLEKIGQGIYEEYGFKERAYADLKSALTAYIEKLENKPLFIFVDELDRVRPNYSIEFLEAIKHIFAIQGICFVIAVDKVQLEKSTKHVYGDIDFINYYMRFITREANLPEITNIDLTPHIKELGKEFFDEKRSLGIAFPFAPNEQIQILNNIDNICRANNLNGRQILAFFRIFSQFMAINSDKNYEVGKWIRGSIHLIALSVCNQPLYKNFGKATLTAKEVDDYIDSLNFSHPPHNDNKRYYTFDIIGLHIKEQDTQYETDREKRELADIILKNAPDLRREDMNAAREEAIRIATKGDDRALIGIRNKSIFEEIYKNLENWRSFID